MCDIYIKSVQIKIKTFNIMVYEKINPKVKHSMFPKKSNINLSCVHQYGDNKNIINWDLLFNEDFSYVFLLEDCKPEFQTFNTVVNGKIET